jgi:ketosteroid isomerase-like protein
MSAQENVQIVKDFFAAMGSYNEQDLLALAAEDIEWIIPGEGWPLAGTYRGHAELAGVLKKASKEVEMKYPKPPEFLAQGDRSWSSASLREKSMLRISRTRTSGSSTLPFEMAK